MGALRKTKMWPVFFGFLFACSLLSWGLPEQKLDWGKFDADSRDFYEKGAALRLEGLQRIVHCEHLPTTDGNFSDYVDVLCALPPRKEHYPLIIELLRKADPYIQEAGVKLATASVRKLNDYSGLESPICDVLRQTDLDPWVLHAIVEFASVSCNTISPPLVKFYGAFAAVAYERLSAKRAPEAKGKTFIMRTRGIEPYENARRWVIQVMLTSKNPTPRSEAVLPYLERAFNTKGWADTCKAAANTISSK
jgi:hypothetical protein